MLHLEEGRTYLTQGGWKAKVTKVSKRSARVIHDGGREDEIHWHYLDGKYMSVVDTTNEPYDIVAEDLSN